MRDSINRYYTGLTATILFSYTVKSTVGTRYKRISLALKTIVIVLAYL